MAYIAQFNKNECVTAAITSHLESGENFDGPVCVGVYQQNELEIFIDLCGVRTNIDVRDVDLLCRELKRAKAIAQGR